MALALVDVLNRNGRAAVLNRSNYLNPVPLLHPGRLNTTAQQKPWSCRFKALSRPARSASPRNIVCCNHYGSSSIAPATAVATFHHGSLLLPSLRAWRQLRIYLRKYMLKRLRLVKHGLELDHLAKMLVVMSVLPSFVLAVEPLAAATASSFDWQGPLRDMYSFTVLLSVFLGKEPGAAAACLVSAAGAALAMFAGQAHPPLAVCLLTGLFAAAGALVLLIGSTSTLQQVQEHRALAAGQDYKSSNSSASSSEWHDATLQQVQQVLGVLGGGLLAQLLSCQVGLSAASPAAAVMGAGAAVLLQWRLATSRDSRMLQLWADWPAWSATLLLILQPLQLLVETSFNPQLLAGSAVSGRQQVLLLLASGLMVPRALLARELMWFTGTCTAALLAAAQILVMAAYSWVTQTAAAGMWHSAAVNGVSLPLGCSLPLIATASSCTIDQITVPVMVAALLLTFGVLQAGWGFISHSHQQAKQQQALSASGLGLVQQEQPAGHTA